MDKRFEKMWSTIEILIIYMFSGLSMGIGITVTNQFPIIILMLIGFGSIFTVLMLHLYCKRNELKIFGRPIVWLIGLIFWAVSMVSIIYIKSY